MKPESVKTKRLGHPFYSRPTCEVARNLLGKLLVRQLADGRRLSGIVVEVEAYLSCEDQASHSWRGLKKSNASMFLAAGRLYVYPIHSRHCLNVVTESEGTGAAVLIRAMEPWEGWQHMADHRGIELPSLGPSKQRNANLVKLGSGPGRLAQALAVDRQLDGIDLLSSRSMWFEQLSVIQSIAWQTCCGPRIGISRDREKPLRWFIDGNRFVSGCAREHSAGRHWNFSDQLSTCTLRTS